MTYTGYRSSIKDKQIYMYNRWCVRSLEQISRRCLGFSMHVTEWFLPQFKSSYFANLIQAFAEFALLDIFCHCGGILTFTFLNSSMNLICHKKIIKQLLYKERWTNYKCACISFKTVNLKDKRQCNILKYKLWIYEEKLKLYIVDISPKEMKCIFP